MDVLCDELTQLGATIEKEMGSVMVVGHSLCSDSEVSAVISSVFGGCPNHADTTSWTAWMAPEMVNESVAVLHEKLIAGRA